MKVNQKQEEAVTSSLRVDGPFPAASKSDRSGLCPTLRINSEAAKYPDLADDNSLIKVNREEILLQYFIGYFL